LRSLRIILGVCLLISLALWFNLWDGLRGGYGWRWGYAAPTSINEWLPSLLAVLGYGLGSLWVISRRRGVVLAWAVLGGALLPIIFLTRWGDPLYEQYTRVASGLTSGPHLVATQYSPATIHDTLRGWTDEQERLAETELSIHAALAPPGLPLLYYGTSRALEKTPFLANPLGRALRPLQCDNLMLAQARNAQLASAVVGIASPVWAALAVLPLFWLAKLVADEITARRAVLLWALVPGVALFTPTPNTVFPTLAMLCIVLLWAGMAKNQSRFLFAAGVVAGILTFLNFSVVPILLFCGFLALAFQAFFARPVFWSLRVGVVFGLGLVVVWGAWLLYGGEPPWAMLHTAMSQHLELERPYLPWLFLHLWDYALFFGLPLMALGVWAFVAALRQARTPHALHLLALVWGATLLVLDFSGTARGETGRVWQFFFPISLLLAAGMLRSAADFRLLLGGQAFAALVLALYIPVIGTGLNTPAQEPPPLQNPYPLTITNIGFGADFRLVGFGGALDAQNNLVVDLQWAADRQSEQPYYVAIIPVAPNGNAYRESYVYLNDAYPTTCWQAGQTIVERVKIPLDDTPPIGDWWLSLTVHDYHSYTPLPVTLPDGSQDQQAGIGAIEIPPSN